MNNNSSKMLFLKTIFTSLLKTKKRASERESFLQDENLFIIQALKRKATDESRKYCKHK
jgi:hypothetical protein